jgi:hypothetical protein
MIVGLAWPVPAQRARAFSACIARRASRICRALGGNRAADDPVWSMLPNALRAVACDRTGLNRPAPKAAARFAGTYPAQSRSA